MRRVESGRVFGFRRRDPSENQQIDSKQEGECDSCHPAALVARGSEDFAQSGCWPIVHGGIDPGGLAAIDRRKFVLIDGDVHNPQQHEVFGIPFSQGLCELLRDDVNVENVVHAVGVEGLWLLSSGYCDSASLQAMAGDPMTKIMSELKSQYDFIVIDSGPVLTGADPLLLGQLADVTLLSSLVYSEW